MKKSLNKYIIPWLSGIGMITSILILLEITLTYIHIEKLSVSLFSGLLGHIIPLAIAVIIAEIFFRRSFESQIDKLKIELRQEMLHSTKETLEKSFHRPNIFISYTHDEKDIAIKFLKDLSDTNITTYTFENSINVGDNISDKLNTILKDSDFFVFLFSKDWDKSEYFEKELQFALKNNKKIFPILTEKNTVLPKEIQNIKYSKTYENYYSGLEELMKSIKSEFEKTKLKNTV